MDLMDVAVAVGHKVGTLGRAVAKFAGRAARFAYRHRLMMMVVAVISVACAFYLTRGDKRRMRMESEVRVNVMDAFYYNDLTRMLDYMCQNKDYKSLGRALNMEEEVAEHISAVKSFFYIDDLHDGTPDYIAYDGYKADTGSVVLKDRLILRVVVNDTADMQQYRKGLQYYFDHNPMVAKMNTQRMSSLDGRIGNLEKEATLLDSLRRKEYFSNEEKTVKLSGSYIVAEKDKQLFHGPILELENEKNRQVLEKNVYPNSVNFVSDFVLVKKENGLVKTFVLVFAFLFFVASSICYVTDHRKDIVNYLEGKEKK